MTLNPSPSHSSMRSALRAYLDKWEAWEASNHRDASIPAAEWNALVALSQHEFKQAVVDDVNYVGMLLERAPKIGPITKLPDELMLDPVSKAPTFRTAFELPEGRGVFPREGYGFAVGEEAPYFPQKKRAKQFAAKHALAWLDDHAPSSSSSPSRPSSSPLNKKLKTSSSSSSSSSSPSPPPTRPQQPTPAEAAAAAATLKRVSALARKLGFDSPRYVVELHDDGTFSARAVFRMDGRMPEGLGVVEGMGSEARAKMGAAEGVQAWLREREKDAQADVDMLMGEAEEVVEA